MKNNAYINYMRKFLIVLFSFIAVLSTPDIVLKEAIEPLEVGRGVWHYVYIVHQVDGRMYVFINDYYMDGKNLLDCSELLDLDMIQKKTKGWTREHPIIYDYFIKLPKKEKKNDRNR